MKIVIDLEELFVLQIVYLKKQNFPPSLIDALKAKKDRVLEAARKNDNTNSIPFLPVISNNHMSWCEQMAKFVGYVSSTDVYYACNGFAYNEEKTQILNKKFEPYFMISVELLSVEIPIETSWGNQARDIKSFLAGKELVGMNHIEATTLAFMDRELRLTDAKWRELCAVSTSWDGYDVPGIFKASEWPFGISWIDLGINEVGKLNFHSKLQIPQESLRIPVYQLAV